MPGYAYKSDTENILYGSNTSEIATTELTLEAWFRPSLDDINDEIDIDIVGFGVDDGEPASMNMAWSCVVAFYVKTTTGEKTIFTTSPFWFVTYNQWNHLVGRWKSGEKTEIWCDGVKKRESDAVLGGSLAWLPDKNIWLNGGGYYGQGNATRYDEVRIYNRKLTDEEIAAHYNSGAGTWGEPETGLVAGWHFENNLLDYSGNGKNLFTYQTARYDEGLIAPPATGPTAGQLENAMLASRSRELTVIRNRLHRP